MLYSCGKCYVPLHKLLNGCQLKCCMEAAHQWKLLPTSLLNCCCAGLFLFENERADGTKLKAVDHNTTLEVGDTLWFAGNYLPYKAKAQKHMHSAPAAAAGLD